MPNFGSSVHLPVQNLTPGAVRVGRLSVDTFNPPASATLGPKSVLLPPSHCDWDDDVSPD